MIGLASAGAILPLAKAKAKAAGKGNATAKHVQQVDKIHCLASLDWTVAIGRQLQNCAGVDLPMWRDSTPVYPPLACGCTPITQWAQARTSQVCMARCRSTWARVPSTVRRFGIFSLCGGSWRTLDVRGCISDFGCWSVIALRWATRRWILRVVLGAGGFTGLK